MSSRTCTNCGHGIEYHRYRTIHDEQGKPHMGAWQCMAGPPYVRLEEPCRTYCKTVLLADLDTTEKTVAFLNPTCLTD